jgi:hypothetical protein
MLLLGCVLLLHCQCRSLGSLIKLAHILPARQLTQGAPREVDVGESVPEVRGEAAGSGHASQKSLGFFVAPTYAVWRKTCDVVHCLVGDGLGVMFFSWFLGFLDELMIFFFFDGKRIALVIPTRLAFLEYLKPSETGTPLEPNEHSELISLVSTENAKKA